MLFRILESMLDTHPGLHPLESPLVSVLKPMKRDVLTHCIQVAGICQQLGTCMSQEQQQELYAAMREGRPPNIQVSARSSQNLLFQHGCMLVRHSICFAHGRFPVHQEHQHGVLVVCAQLDRDFAVSR